MQIANGEAMTEYDELLARLRAMGERQTKHDYSIGHYWNAVDDAADAIRDLQAQLDAERKVLEAISIALNVVNELALERKDLAEAAEAKLAKGKEILLSYCGPSDEPLLNAISRAFDE